MKHGRSVRRGRRRGLLPAVPAAMAIALVLVGCSDPVVGVADAPALAPAGGDMTSAVLQRIPSGPSTLRSISVTDSAVLNTIALRREFPSEPAADRRPAAEIAFREVAKLPDDCGRVLDDPTPSLRSGVPGISITLLLGSQQDSGELGLCQGRADPVAVQQSFADSEGAARTVAGVVGISDADGWIGIDDPGNLTYLTLQTPPEDLVTAAISGPPLAQGSVAQNPRVRAVLDAMPGAAMVVMGTKLVATPRSAAPTSVVTALDEAVTAGSFVEPPVPEFGGYGWIPGRRISGTAVFVTWYGSPEEARTMTTVLQDVWQRLGTSVFSAASTQQQGSVVITRVQDVAPEEFGANNTQLGEYPAFLTRA